MHGVQPDDGYFPRGTSLSLPLPTQRYKGADFARGARHRLSTGVGKGSPGGNSPPGLLSVGFFESFSVTLPETENLGKNKIFELINVKRMDI